MAVSFPRIRPETGGYEAVHPVDDRQLAQIVFAFRLALPDVPLVFSTRESPGFRDAMAGLGICRMSAGSRTTVGGYATPATTAGQFDVHDRRSVSEITASLRTLGFDPIFKNSDAVYRDPRGEMP